MESPSLFAYLSYPDAPAGIEWLTAIGFEVVPRQDDGDRVVHAELRLGHAVVMVSSDDAAYAVPPVAGRSTGAGLYLRVDEVDALFDTAIAAGATPLFPPEDTEWGSRRARVLDPQGREWSFGQYEPGHAWG